MIRLALLSQDRKLQPLLAPALGREFNVLPETDMSRLQHRMLSGSLDVLLLDLDSEFCNVGEQVAVYEEVRDSGVAVVVMTDDASRATASDLVERGAHSYCRKPPALRDL